MDSVYLISLIVGGFFVLLSVFGAGESDSDVDMDADFDHDFDFDLDADHDFDSEFSVDAGSGLGVVDLLSVRALFLFAAFFGLTGVILGFMGSAEPRTAILSATTGLLIGIGGNFIIKRFAYEHVSSQVSDADIQGRTAQVLLPFKGSESGKILVEAGGKRLQITARLFESTDMDAVQDGDQVVVVRMKGRIAEVVKPD